VPTDDDPDRDPQPTAGDAVPDQQQPKDTDRVTERTAAADDVDTGFDVDAPGNYVDDRESPEVPEPNEPA
jgi:hypothetical protein